MATKNLVSASLTPADIGEIKQALQTINTKLPFLISLTDEQRTGGLRLGDKSFGFIDKVDSYIKSNPQLVPSYLDTTEFGKDYQLTKDLLEIMRIIKPLTVNMEDTCTESGIEAFAAALAYYNAIKTAAKQGVPGAQAIYDDLQKRFPGSSSKAATEPAK